MNLDSKFLSPFAVGVQEVFKIQCDLPVTVGNCRKVADGEPIAGDIRGVIAVDNGAFRGQMHLGFPEMTYIAILSKMFGENYSKVTPELLDGAGELANMVFGHAKRVLNERGFQLEMARPETSAVFLLRSS